MPLCIVSTWGTPNMCLSIFIYILHRIRKKKACLLVQRVVVVVWLLMHATTILAFFRFGTLAFGVYPLGLELSVEATYPLDEATGTVLIFLSGQIQGAILIIFSGLMAQELDSYGLSIEVLG